MGRRWQRFIGEVTKFLAVGGVATGVAFVLFNLLVHGYWAGPGPLHGNPLVAYALANLVGMVISYRGSRSWAFRHREAVGPTGGRITYVVVNTASMLLPMGCLAVSRYVLGLDSALADNIAANVVGLGLGTMARFWLIRRFIFLTPGRARERETTPS